MKQYHYLKPLKPTEFERILAEIFERSHKCLWYKVLFKRRHPNKFVYQESEGRGIGRYLTMICKDCGATMDLTDYDSW